MNDRAFWFDQPCKMCVIAYVVRLFVCARYYDRDPFETFAAVFTVEYLFHLFEFGCQCDALPLVAFFATWMTMSVLRRKGSEKTFVIAYALMAASGCDRPGETIVEYQTAYPDSSITWLVLARSRLFAVTLMLFSSKMKILEDTRIMCLAYAMGLLALWVRLHAGHAWASLVYAVTIKLTIALYSKIESMFR